MSKVILERCFILVLLVFTSFVGVAQTSDEEPTWKPDKNNRPKWSVSTNALGWVTTQSGSQFWADLTGIAEFDFLFGGASRNKNTADFFSRNATFSIEPEIELFDRLNLKVPISFGFRQKPIGDLVEANSTHGSWIKTDIFDLASQPGIVERADWVQDREIGATNDHGRDLLFQIGLYPKFYPFKKDVSPWYALYVVPGVNIGLADHQAIDYYLTFDTLKYDGTNSNFIGQTVWDDTESTIHHKNNFLFFRFEGLVGVNFYLTKNLGLSIESGYSTPLGNRGKREDNVYVRYLENEEYELVHSENYMSSQESTTYVNAIRMRRGHFINRLHLVWSFGFDK